MDIRELWRFPVKSMGGEQVSSVEIGPTGFEGDRQWGIFHADTGTVLTARRAPELLFASARLAGPDDVVITLPDGTETTDDAVLSAWLQRDVRLQRPTGDGPTFEVPLDFENDDDWRSWQGPADTFHDSPRRRISIVGSDTLDGQDVRRFRTNVVIAGSGEDAWVGHRIDCGTATLDVMKPIDRCVMVTRAQPGLPRDLDVLKDIIRTRDNFLSVGAVVVTPGTVSVGDVIQPH